MTIDLVKFSEVGTLTTTQMDGNLTTIETALNAEGEMALLDKATTAQLHSWTGEAGVTAAGVDTALDYVTLTDATTIAVDFDTFFNGAVTLTANRALGNPTNVDNMATRQILVKGSDGTARTLTFGANYEGDLPTLADITSTKYYLLTLQPVTATHIIVSSVRAL